MAAGEFDEILDAEVATAPLGLSSGLEKSEFDDVLDAELEQQRARARTLIDMALQDNPDAAAERLKLSQTTGLSPAVIARNQEEIKRKEMARAIDLQRMMRDSPILYRQLTDPNFTGAAIDDLDRLKQLERTFGNIAEYARSGELVDDTAGAARSLALGGTVGVGKMIFDIFGAATDFVGLDSLSAGYRTMSDDARASMDAFGMDVDTSTGKAVKSGLESAGQNIALLPIGLARGLFKTAEAAAAAVAAAMSTGVGAEAYLRARGQGEGKIDSTLYGLSDAGVEFLMERVPAAKLFRGIETNQPFLKMLAEQTVSEGWTEQVTTIAQDFNEWMLLNPEKSTAEFLAERPEAAYQTFIATLVGTGVQTSAIAGINKIVERATDKALSYEHDRFTRQLQLAANSALRERSPEQFRAYVERAVEAQDGPKEVYVDAEVLNQLPPELLEQLPPAVREQIPDALDANSSIAIPMADVLTIAPGTELQQILNDNARIGDPKAPSRVEAQQAEQFIREESERVLQQAADQDAWQQSVETVRTTILDQLNTAQRFTPEVNERYADLQAAFFSTMAARAGTTPDQLYSRFALKVAAQGQGGEVLNDLDQQFRDALANSQRLQSMLEEEQRLSAEVDAAYEAGAENADDLDAQLGDLRARIDDFAGQFASESEESEPDEVGIEEELAATWEDWRTIYRDVWDEQDVVRRVRDILTNNGTTFRSTKDVTPKQALEVAKEAWDAKVESRRRRAERVSGELQQRVLRQSRDVTNTPEFRAWFGDSKVVDADGKPLVVYHGTTGDFSEFKENPIRQKLGDSGFYFSDSRDQAVEWAEPFVGAAGGNVMPVYLALANPLVHDFGGETFQPLSMVDIVTKAKEGGHDGVIVANIRNFKYGPESTTYIAFRPEQIKSATGNRGTFDGSDPNILNQSVSTRLPTAKKATENPLESMLVIGLDAAKADPKAFEKNVELIRKYPNFRDNKSASTPDKAAEQFIRHIVDNLLWLHDQISPETRARARLWYDGANAIAMRWADKYGLSDFQISGVLAVLSPQKDWFQNVSLGERVLDIMSTKQGFTWTDEMSATAASIPALNPEDVGEITGKKLGELQSDYLQAMWVRVYDQTYNERGYRIVTPEGEFGDWVVNADGKTRSKTAWGSFNEIGKAISIFKEGGIANISASLGEQHKVRNFYNNIFSPNSEHGDVTIDTHAVAAALLRPLSGGSLEVLHNFGSGGAASSSVFGSKGTYGIYAEAYRRAAAERGILPRQMQSITWEAVRSLFTAGFKSQEANVAKIDAIWNQYRNRRISLDEARKQLFDAAGGISAFEWERSSDGTSQGPWASSYTEELDPARGADRAAGRGDRGLSAEPAAGELRQQARGTFSPDKLLLTLNDSADLSTFLHESGHFFLEVLADLASQPGAPQQIVDDMGTFLTWAGVPDLATWNGYTLNEKRPHHEKFAESFEQYLLEGRAPTTELQPLFRTFRTWLLRVYRSLSDFMRGRNLQVNDEIRQVFDRMLATDEEIKRAEEAAGLLPDFDATNEAIERLQSRSLRDLKWTLSARDKIMKRLTKEAESLRRAMIEKVRAEVEQRPIYRAMRWLRKGEVTTEAGEQIKAQKGFRLSTEALAEMYPESMLSRPDLERLKGMTQKTGVHPDIVADMFGFANGDALVRELIAAEPLASVVEGMVDQRMIEEHADLATPDAIAAAADDAVHNEARARSLATELKGQQEMLSERQDTGRTDKRGRAITTNALLEAAKQFAQNLAARRRVNDLKRSAHQHRAAEARAGKRWQEATSKGKTQEAVQAKRDQLLNHQAVRALLDAQSEVQTILTFFRKVMKGNNEKIVKGGRDPDVVNAMRAILGAYGVAPRAQKGALEYMETVKANDPAMAAALMPGVTASLDRAMPLGELTMEELRGLHDELKAMWDLAKRSRQMEIDGDLLEIDDLADELYARMEEIGIPDQIPGETGALTKGELRARNWLQQAPALLRRVEQWAEAKDGKFGGPFLRFIFQPVKDAADRYRAERLEYRRKFQALVDAIAPSMRKVTIEAPELGYTFGRGHNGIGMAELLHAILHTGNPSNKRKLLLGREIKEGPNKGKRWADENEDGTLDTSRWDAFIQRMIDEGTLTKAHYDFAQGVWDLLESTKPLAQKTHREVFGRYFNEITAEAFVTPFGTYRGGYVPAQADPLMVKDADLRELIETENAGMAFAFPSTDRGFTRGRVEYNRPLKLDLRTLPQHIDKVLLFSHMEPAVRGVERLLRRKKVQQALGRIDPAAVNGMLKPWLNRAARQTVETPISADAGMSRMASTARARTGMALMMGNVSNTLQQITGLSTANLKVRNSHLRRAVAQYVADPKRLKESVWSMSSYMADRASNEVAVLSDTLEEILLNPTMLESGKAWTRRHAYFLQTAFDNQLSPIIWTAAYNQALEEGMEDRMAIRFADGVIRQTQGSTLPEDISRIESGPAWARLFTQFVGYFNMLANTNATALLQIAREVGLRKGAGRAFHVALMGLMVPIWVAEAIAQAFRGGPDDEDEDGYLDDWMAAVFGFGTIRGILATVPFIGAIGQSAIARGNDNPMDDRLSVSPVISVIESAAGAPVSLYKAIADEGNARTAVRDVSALITLFTGLPAMAAARPLGYAAGVAQGSVEPTGPVDAARGLVTGSVSPDSRAR